MIASVDGRNLIKSLEGLSLVAYPDGESYSIGYGHNGVSAGTLWSREQADDAFAVDVQRFESAVSAAVAGAGMDGTTQPQFDALVSLAYNIGVGAFNQSTLLRHHNAREYSAAAAQFDVWRKAGGAVHPGLVKRRARERAVYEAGSPVDGAAAPYEPAPSSFPPPLPAVVAGGTGTLIFFCPFCGGRCSASGET